jgi:NADH-quinone oxidoreductase subunit C
MHNQIAEYVNSKVTNATAIVNSPEKGDHSITVKADSILEVCKALKSSSEFEFNVLQVITGTDYPAASEIELTYVLASFTKNLELLLKVRLPRGDKNNLPKINSVVSVWNAANYQERETFDMIGVTFVGHPDHRRILTPDDWDGHPLRRDYVVQEKYLGMVVNPAHKVNTEDHFFGKKLRETMDPKQVVNSWKSDDDAETAEA